MLVPLWARGSECDRASGGTASGFSCPLLLILCVRYAFEELFHRLQSTAVCHSLTPVAACHPQAPSTDRFRLAHQVSYGRPIHGPDGLSRCYAGGWEEPLAVGRLPQQVPRAIQQAHEVAVVQAAVRSDVSCTQRGKEWEGGAEC